MVSNEKFATNIKNHEKCILFHSVSTDDNTNCVTNSASYNAFSQK